MARTREKIHAPDTRRPSAPRRLRRVRHALARARDQKTDANARCGGQEKLQEKMLSTAFREAGYATAHFGKWHLNQTGPDDHPLPRSDPHNPGELGFDYWLSNTSGFDLGEFELSRNGKRETFNGEGSEIIVEEAVKYVREQAKRNRPVFAVIWYSAPHGPWRAPIAAAPGELVAKQ